MNIRYLRLSDIPVAAVLALVNDPAVTRHMPLSGAMDEAMCRAWVAGKDAQWVDNGYGPWAFEIDGEFAGWGGFQKEGEDADLGLVLLPRFWGVGVRLARLLIDKGFAELGLPSIIALLPPSRRHLRALERLGFVPDGSIDYSGRTFLRFRLYRPDQAGSKSRP
ncbi:GNAT family N-acetyltransferase [Devosia nitrariae]|uniref:Acetyltransferase n=1 Tax=Devosia nitrariae TaxID=2071872 RepID=A0ABQ5W878_9HYPH|nr:GNAT family N-acetyltransferase [Devosia nitrariae]GLQ55961.1 acetyltransferase [Devosia nitrariae]